MQKLRSLTVGLGAFALVAAASAQFDGPAPLAWRFMQPTAVVTGSSPLVNGDTIYQAVGGRIYCIDRVTGNKRWQYPQLDPIPGAFRSTPVLVGDTLIAVGDNKYAYALDANRGEPKWSVPLPDGVIGAPVISGKYLVVSLSTNALAFIDIEKGEMVGDRPYKIDNGITGSIGAFGDDVIVLTGRNEMLAISATSQKLHWQQRLTQLAPNPVPVVANDTIYINSGNYLIALNPNTGTLRWQVPAPSTLTLSPVVGTKGIMVVTQDGKAIVYDPQTHRPLTKDPIDIGSVPIAKPTPDGDKFIILTANGGINLVDPASKNPLWIYTIHPTQEMYEGDSQNSGSAGGPPGFGGGSSTTTKKKITFIQASAPAVLAGQTLLVPAKDGSLLAFDKTLGVDFTPPKVEMLFPNAGDQVSGQPPLFFYFRLTDEASGLKTDSIKVDVNGTPLDYKLNKDGTVQIQFTQTGKNRALSDGRKEITVTVSDWMGNTVQQKFSLTIDNALPPIKIPGSDNDTNGPGKGGGFGGGKGGGSGFGG